MKLHDCAVYTNGLRVNLSKSFGANKKTQPYNRNDFDALYAHVPDMQRFYLIPSWELEARMFFRDDVNCGKQQMNVYPDGAERADTWANEYLMHYADVKAKDRLKALLEICCE